MMSNARRNRLAPRAASLLLAGLLSACGATVGQLPEKLGGLPDSAPQRPAETMPFPNVYEPRPVRQAKPLNDEEQKKLESELATLRDAQNKRAIPPPPPPPAKKSAAPGKKTSVPPKTAAKAVAPAKRKQNDPVVPEQKGPVATPKLIN